MKLFTSFGRVISFAWKNIIRNAWIGLATVLVLVLALLSVNVLIGVNALASSAINILEKKIDVSVYFIPETPDAILDQARSYMASLPQSESVKIYNAEQALEEFKLRHAEDPAIIDALNELDENPLGATMIIQAVKTSDYPFLMEALNNPQFSFAIESKTYDDHTIAIEQVEQIATTIRYFGLILTAVFIVFSALIVYNAIRVAIYTQREEIGIMRLVGASNMFVRLPLILDGIMFALLALLITATLIAIIISAGEPYLIAFYDGADPGLKTYFTRNLLLLVSSQALGLSLIVILASWAAVGKYLKK